VAACDYLCDPGWTVVRPLYDESLSGKPLRESGTLTAEMMLRVFGIHCTPQVGHADPGKPRVLV